MDKITHEVRLASWRTIIEQCSARPQGTTVKQWLADNDINEKTYYYWLRRVRREIYSQLSNGLPSAAGQDRLPVSFAEIPVEDAADQVVVKNPGGFEPFKADAVLRSGSLAIGISNSISDRLLERLLEVAGHAR